MSRSMLTALLPHGILWDDKELRQMVGTNSERVQYNEDIECIWASRITTGCKCHWIEVDICTKIW